MSSSTDPRARLMQKWSSQLPVYDRSSLQGLKEDGDEDSEGNEDDYGGENGTQSEFLGAKSALRKMTGLKSTKPNSKGKKKGKKVQGMVPMAMPGYMMVPVAQAQAAGKKKKKRKTLTKRIGKWDQAKCVEELKQSDGLIMSHMKEFYSSATDYQRVSVTVKTALNSGSTSILSFMQNPNSINLITALYAIEKSIKPVISMLKSVSIRKGKKNRFYKASIKVESVLDEQAVRAEFEKDSTNIGRFIKLLILKLFRPCYKHLKYDTREHHEEESFKAIALAFTKLERASQIRDSIYGRYMSLMRPMPQAPPVPMRLPSMVANGSVRR